MSETDPTGHAPNADAGGRAHTTPEEGHPAGNDERSDREVGGPRAAEDAPSQDPPVDDPQRGHGDRPTGMPAHE